MQVKKKCLKEVSYTLITFRLSLLLGGLVGPLPLSHWYAKKYICLVTVDILRVTNINKHIDERLKLRSLTEAKLQAAMSKQCCQ